MAARRRAARAGHPWVYRSDVLTPPPRPGFAPVIDRRGRPLGWAAVHPTSQIAVRLLHRGDAPIDEALLLARLDAALDLRVALVATRPAWRRHRLPLRPRGGRRPARA
jgi:23S rRNA (cytosine1962-C5)-methyltransferase